MGVENISIKPPGWVINASFFFLLLSYPVLSLLWRRSYPFFSMEVCLLFLLVTGLSVFFGFLLVKTSPVFVQGEVTVHPELSLSDVVVAIAVNGIIRAVTTPYFSPEGKLLFNKILPEDALGLSNDVVAVLLPAPETKSD
jgi:hypothetical protein